MNDGQRQYPVNIFVLHHSTGPRFADTADIVIQDWFSDTGKARGYSNGALNPMHEHPSRPGQLTYSMAQFAGSPDSSNKYNYKLTDLIARPWGNVAWHAGNWDINVHSCGLENCGNFMDMVLETRQLMCIADFLRGIDQELVSGGHPEGLTLMLHQEIFATACPGRIKEQRDTIVDMINNPAKWNASIFPPAKTAEQIAAEKAAAAAVIAANAAAALKASQEAAAAKLAAEIAAAAEAKRIADAKTAADKVIADKALADIIAEDAVKRAKALADSQAAAAATVNDIVVQAGIRKFLQEFWMIIINFLTKGK